MQQPLTQKKNKPKKVPKTPSPSRIRIILDYFPVDLTEYIQSQALEKI